jgi:hypothetical protein
MASNGSKIRENTPSITSSLAIRWIFRSFVLLLANFGGTGRRATRMIAAFLGLFRVLERMFPTVKYIGHAFLSPEKFVK